jgi:DNA modification methylase
MRKMKIAIGDIHIGDRIRKDFGDIDELASSISRVGQLQPIVLDQENRLVAGHRRLQAVMQLGLPEIEAIRLEDLDEATRVEIELEENLKRKDLDWVEEIRGLKKLYELKLARYGQRGKSDKYTRAISSSDEGNGSSTGYGVEDAASDLGKTKGSISMDLELARGLEEFPFLAEEKSKAAAFKRYARELAEKMRKEVAARARSRQEDPEVHKSFEDWKTEAAAQAEDGSVPPPPRMAILKRAWKGHGILYRADARDVLRLLPEESIDCIVTDPPFGLGMFRKGQAISGARLAEAFGDMYDDDPHAIMDMLDETFMHAAKLLKPDGHAYIFFHMSRYEETYLMLRRHFGTCEETPIVWIKNTPGIGDPNMTWVYAYTPIFWVNRGRHLVKAQAFNYLKFDTVPPSQKTHAMETPLALMRHLIGASCISGEVVLDPFAGSGNTLIAAHQLGCRFIGVEKHDKFHSIATDRIAEALAETPAASEGTREVNTQ